MSHGKFFTVDRKGGSTPMVSLQALKWGRWSCFVPGEHEDTLLLQGGPRVFRHLFSCRVRFSHVLTHSCRVRFSHVRTYSCRVRFSHVLTHTISGGKDLEYLNDVSHLQTLCIGQRSPSFSVTYKPVVLHTVVLEGGLESDVCPLLFFSELKREC